MNPAGKASAAALCSLVSFRPGQQIPLSRPRLVSKHSALLHKGPEHSCTRVRMIAFFVECMLLSRWFRSVTGLLLSACVHTDVVVPMLLYHEQTQADPCTRVPADIRPVCSPASTSLDAAVDLLSIKILIISKWGPPEEYRCHTVYQS